MKKQTPLAGLNPADLLRQGVAEDTFIEGASAPFSPPSLDELAAIFPQFEMLELIGQGGMGAVYKVRQKDLDRIVALKILPAGIGQSPEFSNRFTREAKALAKLNHPGIVTIHEFGQQDGLYFILMEYVDGVNLAQLMKTGRVSPREALAIVPQICDALQYAHDQGIVHRDIKPENLLLDRQGRVKVADFGIAKVVASVCEPIPSGDIPAHEDQTLAGKIIGTPQYMAPEQIEHPADVDHRADIYALGVVFYQMLTGELPGKDLQAPSKKVHIDVRLDEIVLKAMENNPELRFQQASLMKTRMDGLQSPKRADVTTSIADPRLTEPFAITSLILGILSFILGPLTALPAIVFGHLARKKMLKNPALLGNGIALTGMILGYCLLVISSAILSVIVLSYSSLGSSTKMAAVALREYDWNDLAASGQADGRVLVTIDGQTCLKIENPSDSPLTTRLLTIDTPPLNARQYAVLGEVRYENVQGMAYLEMWNEFPQGRFFSRTMDKPGSGAMAQLTGTSDWRPFSLPFDQLKIANPPNRLEVNLHLPGRGVVIVGPLRLCEFVTEEVAVNRVKTIIPPVTVDVAALSIVVSGEVRKAGPVRLETPASLLSVLAAAGGWTEKADPAGILLRMPGEQEAQIIDLTAILRGEAVNPFIPPGAIIEIREKSKP